MRLVHLAPDKLNLYQEYFRADFNRSHPAGADALQNHTLDSRRCLRTDRERIPEGCREPLTAISPSSDESPVLVSGFRRYLDAIDRDDPEIPVIVIPCDSILSAYPDICKYAEPFESISDWKKAGWILALQKISPIHHSPLEIAGVLSRASKALNCPVRRLADFCPPINSIHHASAVITAAALPVTLLKRCKSWSIDVSKAALLSRYTPSERPVATVLSCCMLKLSVSRMRRFEELVRDIALREHSSLLNVLRTLQRITVESEPDSFMTDIIRNFKQKLAESSLSKSDRSKRIGAGWSMNFHDSTDSQDWMRYLEVLRSPERAYMSQIFDRIVNDSDIHKSISVSPPPDFEGDHIDLNVRIRTMNDLENALKALRDCSDTLQSLLNLVRNDE